MSPPRATLAVGLLLICACAQAAGSPPTAHAMWSEFREACGGSTLSGFETQAAKTGWTSFEPKSGSYFAKQREFARRVAAKVTADIPKGAFVATDKLFTKHLGNRDIYLWVAPGTVQKDGDTYQIVTCSVADPAAEEPISESTLVGLGHRSPERFGGDLVVGYRWIPGVSDGESNTVVMFIPASSQQRLARVGVEMKGLVLKEQSITKVQK